MAELGLPLLHRHKARMIDATNRSPSVTLDQPFVSSVLFPYTSNLVPDCGVLRVLICSLSASFLDFSKTISADLERQSSIFIGLGQGPQEK